MKYKKYTYKKNSLFCLSYKVDKLTKPNLTLYIVYDADKIAAVLKIVYKGQSYEEFKYNRLHGITFKQQFDIDLPSIYANFRYGVLHGYYFATVKYAELCNNELAHYNNQLNYNLRYAVSALYEKGTTEYINCITFDRGYSLQNIRGITKYSFSTTRVCDAMVYANLISQPKFLNGWSKYGDEYTYYQNGKVIKRICRLDALLSNKKSTTYSYFIYDDAITYKYLTGDGITNLEIKVNAKKDSIIEINPVTKNSVVSVHTVVKYTWYKNQLLILMERTIAPNYCSVAKYQYVKDHDKQLWTSISVNADDYVSYIDYDSL